MTDAAHNLTPLGRIIPSKFYDAFVAKLPTMDGKVVAVTGCTSGTGIVFAKTVSSLGATVLMLNRPSARADAALEEVKKVAKGTVVPVACDLNSFESVRAAAASIKKDYAVNGIDVLCNNAGIMMTANDATVDGNNVEMQVNHFSHFLLTAELWPLLEKAAERTGDARVVNHSSGARNMPFIFTSHTGLQQRYFEKDLKKHGGDHGTARMARYGQTKLANSVFTNILATRQSKVKALCAHPGVCASNLSAGTKASGETPWFTRKFLGFAGGAQQSQEDGTLGILSAACLPDVKPGQLWGPKNDGISGPAVPVACEKDFWFTRSQRMSEQALWEPSLRVTGVSFPFSLESRI